MKKIILKFLITTSILFACVCAFYVVGLPYLVSNTHVINGAQNLVKNKLNANLEIKNPILVTKLFPKIDFKLERLYLEKDNVKLIELENFGATISLKKILAKKLIVKKLVAKSVYVDAKSLQDLMPQEKETKKKKSNFGFEVSDSLLGVKDCEIFYLLNNDTNIHLKGEHIGINNAKKIMKNVFFNLKVDIERQGKKITIKLNDNKNVFFGNKQFHIIDCPISINNSNIFINLLADKKNNFDVTLYSNNFNINDIIDFLNTQIIENTVQKDALSYFNDIKGSVDFKLNIKNDSINGNFKLNNAEFKVKDVDNTKITLTKGNIDLTSDEVKLSGFEGFYDNNKENKIDFEGTIKDYLKTIDTDIVGNAIVRNDFFKNHLSKMTGTELEIKGNAPTRITLKSKNNVMDLVWLFMLKPNENIKVAGNYLPFEDSFRLMKSDMHFENMVLDIKSLDYHMVTKEKIEERKNSKDKERKEKPKPIFTLKSSIDIKNNNYVRYVGFEIPEPLPSELLNVVIGQQVFAKGKISGDIMLDNKGKYPILDGYMKMDKVLIPPQKMFMKEAKLEAKNNLVHLSALGGYRRAKFNFNGDILNQIKFPIVIKNINLSLENIDLLNALEGFNNQETSESVVITDEGAVNVASDNDFDIRNIIIENGKFHLDKGNYKEITFGNLDADLTLNKNGVINIKSNRFDFAEGHSSLNATFDVPQNQYNVKLGFLNVNSDTLANSLLDLKREITGRASGFMDLSTDEKMKLNGSIKFIIKDGAINKIGLVQYVLKCASLLRNTLSMISPAIIADIVNIPEGEFEKITGTLLLKNNVATSIKIKSYSSQLSNYIVGRYNIDNGDTSLRIYTKFSNANKGLTGVLRKISLDTLANRIPMNSRNDLNYYAIELQELPEIEADDKDCQIFLTKVEGDVANNNYISSLKKLK